MSRARFEGGPLDGMDRVLDTNKNPYPVYYALVFDGHVATPSVRRVEYHLERDSSGWVYRIPAPTLEPRYEAFVSRVLNRQRKRDS